MLAKTEQEIARMTPQERDVYTHLEENGAITPLEAYRDYGILRLAAIVYTLKNKHGCDIVTKARTGYNRDGRKVRFAEYSFERKPVQTRMDI